MFTLQAQSVTDPLPIGKNAPVLKFKDMDGKLLSLEHLKGNVIVLNFWNIGCTGCEQERQTLNWLSDSLKQQPVKFVSITMNKKENIAAWLSKHPVTYEFVGNVDFMGLRGPSFFTYNCMPTTVVIDSKGVVRYNQCGPIVGLEEGKKFAAQLTKWQ
ncbi:Peroxiredoxin [Spirosoma endophyticum]|uniref:Peroxiredoxin n=2 Tax=Spirosoma endophyticum TaxID=662367 RepID=A0A1I2GPZ4_9BACT|nr:Peroxiredoxin [Spirosoma endophyticum]